MCLCVVEGSASGGGAVSETQSEAEGSGGQTTGGQRRTGMDPTQGEGNTHTLQIQSSITINLTGNFKGHAIVETYRNKISVDV